VHATSLGGVESTLERRARYASERKVDTPATLVRLSVGLEHPEDLWHDLERALG
jgi:cystathionine gamma-synthase